LGDQQRNLTHQAEEVSNAWVQVLFTHHKLQGLFRSHRKQIIPSRWSPLALPEDEKVCEYQQARLRERARCRPRRRPAHCPRIYALPMNELLLVDVLRSIATSAVPSFCIMASIGASSERVGHHD
jgi:hypothetical protein